MKRHSWILCAVGVAALHGFQGQAAEAVAPRFRAVEIDNTVKIGYGVAVADVNGDKRPDIVLADKDLIVWYQNPGWEKHIIAEKLTQRDHVCIAAADLDGDGKAEIAVGAEWNPGDTVNSGSVHYLIPPKDRTQRWEPVKLPHEPTVHRMRWVKDWQGNNRLVMVPLHGRGNKGGEGAGVRILSYRVPEDPRQEWETSVMNDELHLTHNFDPVEWDGDQAHELLVASKEGVYLLNWADGGFKLFQIGGNRPGESGFVGAGEVRWGRLPNGKRFVATVEPMHGNNVVVYTSENDENVDSLWDRRVIDSSLVDGHAVACGDLLRTGSDQLVVGWRAMNRPGTRVGIKMYVPDKEGKNWKETLVDDNTMACEDLVLADIDGNGWLDIVAAGRATKNLKIYFNEGGAGR